MKDENSKIYLLGRAIFSERRKCGYSQNDLAEMLDISREHLAKIETAKRTASMQLLIKIAEVLHVKVRDLINF